MELDKSLLAKWLFTFCDNETCQKCTNLELCNNRKCPNHCMKDNSGVDAYCGYDDVAIEEVIRLLDQSDSKYIYKLPS